MRRKVTRGFTLVEVALVIAVAGLLLVPLLHTLGAAQVRKQTEITQAALATARDALFAYAAQHHGCLPLAADYEGGQPDTGSSGVAGTIDSGSMRAHVIQRAGDLPWADLALGGRALDGEQHRLQYFVASAITDPAQLPAGTDDTIGRSGCLLRSRTGIESWQANTAYSRSDLVISSGKLYVASSAAAVNVAPPTTPWILFSSGSFTAWATTTAYAKGEYATAGGALYRALDATTSADPVLAPQSWRAVGLPGLAAIPLWQAHATEGYRRGELVSYGGHTFRAVNSATVPLVAPVAGASGPDWDDLTLPDRLLQTRLGPDIASTPGNTVAATQNIAILIAPGRGTNAQLNRNAVRDANHLTCPSLTVCGNWTSLNDTNVDTRAFSLSPAVDRTGTPDTILPISLADYQAAMAKAGLTVQGYHW